MRTSMTDQLPPAVQAETEFDLAAAQNEMRERLRNQMSFAEKSMAALMLANGGALIGLFTFIGNVVGRAEAPLAFRTGYIWSGFASFALGITLVLLTHLFAFLSQLQFYNQAAHEMWRHQRTLAQGAVHLDTDEEKKFFRQGDRYMRAGIAVLIGSLICFMLGAGLSLAGVLPA